MVFSIFQLQYFGQEGFTKYLASSVCLTKGSFVAKVYNDIKYWTPDNKPWPYFCSLLCLFFLSNEPKHANMSSSDYSERLMSICMFYCDMGKIYSHAIHSLWLGHIWWQFSSLNSGKCNDVIRIHLHYSNKHKWLKQWLKVQQLVPKLKIRCIE